MFPRKRLIHVDLVTFAVMYFFCASCHGNWTTSSQTEFRLSQFAGSHQSWNKNKHAKANLAWKVFPTLVLRT